MSMPDVQAVSSEEIALRVPAGVLGATLCIPAMPRGLVIFAHGSGSGRYSARNRLVAKRLNDAQFGTLLMDLLTSREDNIDRVTAEYRFDVGLLAERVQHATQWARERFEGAGICTGYFGASTGAAAALIAAAKLGPEIKAVVSRGGRPDLAAEYLPLVRAATLLIVGGNDVPVIEMNRSAQRQMRATCELIVVPGATHLFEETGALEQVADLASGWFTKYL
jgi:dienelactone hydrolase